MTQPTPTQSRHPWRAVVRTVFAIVVALATLLPYVLAGTSLEAAPGVAQVVAVAAAITRVLALPVVEVFLHDYAPWLAAEPREP